MRAGRESGPWRRLRLKWPAEQPHPGARFWANQALKGLYANDARIDFEDVTPPGPVVRVRVEDGGAAHVVAFDNNDSPDIDEAIAREVLLYFKTQYREGGYRYRNVVPGGYFLANVNAYRVLPLARALRKLQRFRYDVYGRFGLRYGGVEIRKRAYELLSARRDFQFEGSLFRYPGGPDKVPYRKYLLEIPHAKVCVDLPGAGDLTTRLVDYLAIGACVVRPAPSVRLPVQLVDGEHAIYCASDLSDLADVCAELVRDDEERERIAGNAREFFDRNLHRDRLGAYYVRRIAAASDRELAPERRRRRRVVRRTIRTFAAVALATLVLVDVFVVLPEKLGDHPYNALGHNSAAMSLHTH
jgi:hypothetical protein